jgi:hypothetical protein
MLLTDRNASDLGAALKQLRGLGIDARRSLAANCSELCRAARSGEVNRRRGEGEQRQ